MLFILFILAAAGMKGQSFRSENIDRIDSILNRSQFCQLSLIYELRFREQFGKPSLASLFNGDSSYNLYFAKFVLDEFARKDLNPKDQSSLVSLFSAKEFYFLNDDYRSPEYRNGLFGTIHTDSRYRIDSLECNSSIKSAVEDATVLVFPKGNQFGRRRLLGGYSAKRKELCKRILSQNPDVKERLMNQQTLEDGSRSGTIWNNRWILTAGHGFRANDKVFVIRNFTRRRDRNKVGIRNKNERGGRVAWVQLGGAHELDLALIHLNKKFRGVPQSFEGTSADIDYRSQIVAGGHPFGMQAIADIEGYVLSDPADHWKNSPYFFADLDMNRGNSGSPVFQKHIDCSCSSKSSYHLVGMVVGSGGIQDFSMKNGKTVWNRLDEQDVVGTRIVKISKIEEILNTVICQLGNQRGGYREPHGFSRKISTVPQLLGAVEPFLPLANVADITVNLKRDTAFFSGADFYVKYYGNDIPTRYFIGDTALFTMIDSLLFIDIDNTLDGYYSRYPPDRCLEYHTDLWPMDLIANPTHCLKFRYQETLPADMPYRHDVDEKFNMLDGIGLADIVDNLPEVKMRRRQIWLCNLDMLEISISPAMDGNPYQAPIVNIRSVRPFIQTYLRTEREDAPIK